MSEPSPRPPRRPRYSGRNPRRFEDKYKELNPERHAETIAKVLASGKTPAGSHVPILVAECLDALQLRPGMTGIDATLGHGGHALEILRRIQPDGRLIGLDQDPMELPRTADRLARAGFSSPGFEAVRSNYAGIAGVLAQRGLAGADFVLADLGCSSMQLDNPARGFSVKTNGPLDMRMNPNRGLPASEWLARCTRDDLETALRENADEPRAASLADALAGARFATTLELATAVRTALAAMEPSGTDPEEAARVVRRVFQAVRIAVNDEFSSLDAFLRVLPSCLSPGARAVFLTFHSGEDRRVKKAIQAGLRGGWYARASDGVITASPEERRMNPRSSPAKLRWVEACG